MTSLIMGTAFSAVPADPEVVRRTAVPVDYDGPAAEMPSAPDRDEVVTDGNPHLGMVNRTLASHVVPSEQYVPSWTGDVDGVTESANIINRQVSSSGTAAAREASGQFGHGTLQVMQGIEPQADLIDGGKLGNHYFTAHKRGPNESSPRSMATPPGFYHDVPAMVGATGKTAARAATQSSQYQLFLEGQT